MKKPENININNKSNNSNKSVENIKSTDSNSDKNLVKSVKAIKENVTSFFTKSLATQEVIKQKTIEEEKTQATLLNFTKKQANEEKREKREKEAEEKKEKEENSKDTLNEKLKKYFEEDNKLKQEFIRIQKNLDEEIKNLNESLSLENKKKEKQELISSKKELREASKNEKFVKNHKLLSMVEDQGAGKVLTKGVLSLFSKNMRKELKEDYEDLLARAENDKQEKEINYAKKVTEVNYKRENNPKIKEELNNLSEEKNTSFNKLNKEKEEKLKLAQSEEDKKKIEEDFASKLEALEKSYEKSISDIKDKYDKVLSSKLEEVEKSIIEKNNNETNINYNNFNEHPKAERETAQEIVEDKKDKKEEKETREKTLAVLEDINKNQEASKDLQEKQLKLSKEELKADKNITKAVRNIDIESGGGGGNLLSDLFGGKKGKFGKILRGGKTLLSKGGSLLRGAGKLLKVGRVASMATGLIGEGGLLTEGAGAVAALASNPVGWTIGGALAVGAAGVGIYHLMIDDDSEAIMDKLEKSGAVEHNFFGDSEIKDWSQIYSLKKKELDALIRFDDWSDEVKKTLKTLESIDLSTRQFLAGLLKSEILEANKSGILTIDNPNKFSEAFRSAIKNKDFTFSNKLKNIFDKRSFIILKTIYDYNTKKKAKKEDTKTNKNSEKLKADLKDKKDNQEASKKKAKKEDTKTNKNSENKKPINKTNKKPAEKVSFNKASSNNTQQLEKTSSKWTQDDINNIMKYKIDAIPDDLKEISKEKAIKGIKAQFPELSKGIPDNLLALAGLEMFEATKNQNDYNKVTYFVNRTKELLKEFKKQKVSSKPSQKTGLAKQIIKGQENKTSNTTQKAEKESFGETLKNGAEKALELTPLGMIGKGIMSILSSKNKEGKTLLSPLKDEFKSIENSKPVRTIANLVSKNPISEAFSYLFGSKEDNKKTPPKPTLNQKQLPKANSPVTELKNTLTTKKEDKKEDKKGGIISSNPSTQTTIINNYNSSLFGDGRTLSKAYSL